MNSFNNNLSQGERLALAPFSSVIIDPSELGEVEAVTLSTPSGGFRMPSMRDVRMHDARLSAFGGMASMHDDESDDEISDDDESTLYEVVLDKRRDFMKEHSFRLPSQTSRREVSETLRSMGCAYHD